MNKGFATLLNVMIISAIGVMIAVFGILWAVGFLKTSLTDQQSYQAIALAHACAEEALQQISDSNPFTGTSSLVFDQGTCAYEVTSQGGSNRTITASSTVGTIIRKTKVLITGLSPSITISSWQEVADF